MMTGIDFMTLDCVVNYVLWRLKGLVFQLDVVGTDVFTDPGVVCRLSTVCGNTETGLVCCETWCKLYSCSVSRDYSAR